MRAVGVQISVEPVSAGGGGVRVERQHHSGFAVFPQDKSELLIMDTVKTEQARHVVEDRLTETGGYLSLLETVDISALPDVVQQAAYQLPRYRQ